MVQAYEENNFLPTLRSAALNSHIGASDMIPSILTNAAMQAAAAYTSSGLYSPAWLGGSVAKLKVRAYESHLFTLRQCLGGLVLCQELLCWVLHRCPWAFLSLLGQREGNG